MTSKRLYFVMLACVGLIVALLIGGVYALSVILGQEGKKLATAHLSLDVLYQQQADLTRAQTEVKKYQSLAAIARTVVPQDKDQAQTISQIVALANQNNIPLSSISFPASNLGNLKAGKPELSQLATVPDVPGVYSLQLTVMSDDTKPVPYPQFISFLDALEHNRRTALVQNITIQPSQKDRSKLSFTLILNEYLKP